MDGADGPALMDAVGVAAELYALPLDEFTRTRNERARALRDHDKALADTVKALPKPSVAAWVVNQLVRHQAEQMAQVLSLGESLRAAQADLDADALRELSRQRRRLTAAITSQGRALAAELGHPITEAVADQVEQTLRAAMVDDGAAGAVRTGRLLQALSATGVEQVDPSASVALLGFPDGPAGPVESAGPALHVVPGPEGSAESAREQRRRAREATRQDARKAARQAVREAAGSAARAGRAMEKAGERVARLEAKGLQLQGELEEVRRRVDDLEHRLATVDDQLTEAEDLRGQAQTGRDEAEVALAQARAALEDLDR